MREVRLALLEADVSYKVVKEFVAGVTERAIGSDVLNSLTPAQQVIKIVNEEMTRLMGGSDAKISMSGLASIDRINVSSPEILQVTTSQGAEITFSLDHFDVQLRRWRLIYDQYQKWGKAIAFLDLSISNNLPLRWVAANTVQPMVAVGGGEKGCLTEFSPKTLAGQIVIGHLRDVLAHLLRDITRHVIFLLPLLFFLQNLPVTFCNF